MCFIRVRGRGGCGGGEWGEVPRLQRDESVQEASSEAEVLFKLLVALKRLNICWDVERLKVVFVQKFDKF